MYVYARVETFAIPRDSPNLGLPVFNTHMYRGFKIPAMVSALNIHYFK
jgi:hypothetical protein